MVKSDLDVCPNCSHPFPPEQPAVVKTVGSTLQEVVRNTSRPAVGRPFRFILFFMLSFIAILAFMSMEGLTLSGSTDANYLFGDVISVSLVALLISAVLIFIDYIAND